MDEAGVERAYVVSPGFEGAYNDVVLDAVSAYPDRLRAIVRFPIDEPDSDHVADLISDPRVSGARLVFNKSASSWLADGTADWYWALAERLGTPTMVFAPNRSDELATVAELHPGVSITVCHFGVDTKLKDDAASEPLESTIRLARLPNVAAKVTCATALTSEPYPYPRLAERVRRTIDAFGAERAFWGSDLSRLPGSYAELREWFETELGLDDHDRELVMGAAIQRWFPWRV
jgi:predicted TIM-barrel fold metal-dependent hydrolase